MAVLLCTCLAAATSSAQAKDEEGAFSKPKSKRSGKLPRWSFDFGPFNMESFFGEQKLEDRLRLSKAYIRHDVRSRWIPTEDPMYSFKHSRVEELINCENLTTLVQPASRASSIDCRPLEAHTVDPNYVSPVSDLSITRYVRRSSFRAKISRLWSSRVSRHDVLIYPLRRDATYKYIGDYVTENKLGDAKSTLKSNINRGYYFHLDLSSTSFATISCTGNVFLSINSSSGVYIRRSNDPFPQYIDDFHFLFDNAHDNGYLVSLSDIKCGPADSGGYVTLDIDFTISRRQEFPYLFVRHSMITKPFNTFLNYKSSVDQVKNNIATGNPDSYNTTVKIKSSSGLLGFMNFLLNQTISNEDLKTGYETVNFINTDLPIVVDSMWNDTVFFKSFSFLNSTLLDGVKHDIGELMNVSYYSQESMDSVTLMVEIKKTLMDTFGETLTKALGLDEMVSYDFSPEDEQSLREEL